MYIGITKRSGWHIIEMFKSFHINLVPLWSCLTCNEMYDNVKCGQQEETSASYSAAWRIIMMIIINKIYTINTFMRHTRWSAFPL